MRPTLLLLLFGILLGACTTQTPTPYERTTTEALRDLEETQPEPEE